MLEGIHSIRLKKTSNEAYNKVGGDSLTKEKNRADGGL